MMSEVVSTAKLVAGVEGDVEHEHRIPLRRGRIGSRRNGRRQWQRRRCPQSYRLRMRSLEVAWYSFRNNRRGGRASARSGANVGDLRFDPAGQPQADDAHGSQAQRRGSGTAAGPCQVHVSTVLADEPSGFSISFPKLSPT